MKKIFFTPYTNPLEIAIRIEFTQKPPMTIKKGEDPMQVKKRMEKKNKKWAMLTDEKDHFLGWINCDDLNTSKKIIEIIEPPVVTAEQNTRLNVALSMMLKSTIGTIAVLDDENRLAGILSFPLIRDILGKQFEKINNSDSGGKI